MIWDQLEVCFEKRQWARLQSRIRVAKNYQMNDLIIANKTMCCGETTN